MSEERKMGIKLGLDPDFNLAQACADFYLLEMMESQLFQRYQVGDKLQLTDVPIDHGSDSKFERLAYATKVQLDRLESRLEREFVVYINAVCGGELRHAYTRIRGIKTVHKCKHLKALDKYNHIFEHAEPCCKKQSKSHKCDMYCDNKAYGAAPTGELYIPKICNCKCLHNHKDTCTAGLRGCQMVWTQWYQYCCTHECDYDNGCYRKVEPKKPAVDERVKSYFETMRDEQGSCESRSGGWHVWSRLSAEEPVAWLDSCASTFRSPNVAWGGSFGGGPWAVAAEVLRDFLSHKLTRRAFIDRCWSLEHNGGCLFNKLYTGSVIQLGHVLKTQYQNDYKTLADTYAGWYTKELWHNWQLATGRESVLDIIERHGNAIAIGQLPKNWKKPGCPACRAYYFQISHAMMPCSSPNPKQAYDQCATYTWFMQQQDEDPDNHDDCEEPGCAYCQACYDHMMETEEEDPCHKGHQYGDSVNPNCAWAQPSTTEFCAACKWEWQENDNNDPCGWGTPDEPYEDCAHYEKFMAAHTLPIPDQGSTIPDYDMGAMVPVDYVHGSNEPITAKESR